MGFQISPKDKDKVNKSSEDVGFFESALAGVATGLINIPKSVVSLGAEVFDLVGDTNTAASVEKFFDDLNPFDDEAEARTVGRIISAITAIGPAAIKGAQVGVRAAALAKRALDAKKTGKAEVEITKLTNDEKADIIAGALGNIAGALGENSKSAKGLAVAQALIDTYAGATKALAQGGIFGTVAAAGIVAAGLGNVKKIVSTKLPGVNDSSSPPTPDADIPTTSVGGIGGLVPNVEAISPPDISQQPVQAFV